MIENDLNEDVSDGSKLSLPWYLRIVLRWFPALGIRHIARRLNLAQSKYDGLHESLARTTSVDLFPSAMDARGFMLVLDQSTAFYFYQNGDHFEYDGYELGKYDSGDVRLFDEVEKSLNPVRGKRRLRKPTSA